MIAITIRNKIAKTKQEWIWARNNRAADRLIQDDDVFRRVTYPGPGRFQFAAALFLLSGTESGEGSAAKIFSLEISRAAGMMTSNPVTTEIFISFVAAKVARPPCFSISRWQST